MKKILLVSDVQKQFKDKHGYYEKCVDFINQNRNKYDVVIAFVFSQNVMGDRNTMFVDHLGYQNCMFAGNDDLDFAEGDAHVITRNTYSSEYISSFLNENKDELFVFDIIGCNMETDIMAHGFILWDKNVEFNILSDYVYTVNDVFTRDQSLMLLKRTFGTCVK